MYGAAGVHAQAGVVHTRAWPTVAGVGRSAVVGQSRVVTWTEGEERFIVSLFSCEVHTGVVLFNGSGAIVTGVRWRHFSSGAGLLNRQGGQLSRLSSSSGITAPPF